MLSDQAQDQDWKTRIEITHGIQEGSPIIRYIRKDFTQLINELYVEPKKLWDLYSSFVKLYAYIYEKTFALQHYIRLIYQTLDQKQNH